MKISWKDLVVFIQALLFSQSFCFGQAGQFEIVSPPKSQQWILVTGMSQGPLGFLWISTQTGLYRFDGNQFIHFLHKPKNPNSISDNRLECVLADKKGLIWIGTYGHGLDCLNPATGTFTHFRHIKSENGSLGNDTITALIQDSQGIIWVGNYAGLDRIDPDSKIFRHYSHIDGDPSSLSNNTVRAVYEDKEGTIWVGTGSPFDENDESGAGGLNRFDRKTGTFQRYLHNPSNPGSISDNRVRAIFEDSKHNFWIGTAGDGLQTLNRATGVFTHYYYDSLHPEKLSRPPIEKRIPNVEDHITFITEDRTGKLWIGTLEGGINVYDAVTKKIVHYGRSKDSPEKLLTNDFWFAYKTKDGLLWVSTWGSANGIYTLYKINPYENKMPYHNEKKKINSFMEDNAHTLWMGTSQGLVHIKGNGQQEQFWIDKDSPTSLDMGKDVSANKNLILCLAPGAGNKIWLGTRRGLYSFDSVTKKFTRYANKPGLAESLICDTIVSLSSGAPGTLWVGTNRGLDLMNIANKTFKHYNYTPRNPNGISSDYIGPVYMDHSNRLWAGTGNGLDRYDGISDQFKGYLLDKSTMSIMEDTNGKLWAGTISGLYQYDEKKGTFVLFTDAFNIMNASTSVYGITEDHEQNLWLATSLGIIGLSEKNNNINVFGRDYGVNADSLTLGIYTRQNGEILFGYKRGYLAFRPGQISQDIPAPTVNITNFVLSNNTTISIAIKGDPTFFSQSPKINLNYKQNTFSFEFTSIDYISSGDNRLQYMLKNYDHSWQIAGRNKTANYSNVPPGNYVFKVRAVNDFGLWSEKDVTVIISPPWWTRWWAVTIFIFILVSSVWVITFLRARKLKKEKRILEEKVNHRTEQLKKSIEELKSTQRQLIQSEKMASLGELTAGIAHEIQNPLNFVNNFSEVSKELLDEMKAAIEKGDPVEAKEIMTDVIDNLEKINYHGKRADAIVKGMLQHSRSSTGQKEMTDINALCDEYLRLAYHGLRAKDKSFNAKFETDFDPSLPKINAVPQEMGRVILNLINNAFYAVGERSKAEGADRSIGTVNERKKLNETNYEPTVVVSTKRNGNAVEIMVKDNGTGIPQKIIDKIFQPFFTTKPTGQGTGLGLSLAYDIVTKGHGGEINVNSNEGVGSEFVIHLPA